MHALRTRNRLAAGALLSGLTLVAAPTAAFAHDGGGGGHDRSGVQQTSDRSDGGWSGKDHRGSGHHEGDWTGDGHDGRGHHGDCDTVDGSNYRSTWSDDCSNDGNGGVAVSEQDQAFLEASAQTSLFEIVSGIGAITRSENPDVQMLGGRVLVDHATAYVQVAQLDSERGITPPARPSDEQMQILMELKQLNGSTFDCAFVPIAVEGHREAIATFEDEIANGDDPAIVANATATLPVLEEHLAMAEQVEATLTGCDTNGSGSHDSGSHDGGSHDGGTTGY